MKNPNFVTACPKCGSKSIHTEADVSFISGKPSFYVCNECQFSAPRFPKISTEERAKLGKTKTENKKPNEPTITNTKTILIAIAGILGFVFLGLLGLVIVLGIYFAIRGYISQRVK